MNWSIFIIECVIMVVIFGALTFGMLLVNPISFISDYPPEIQERYYESQHKEASKEKLTALMIIKKIIGLIVFAIVFAWMTHLTGAQGFLQRLGVIYGYMIVICAWDVLVSDWLLFPRIKKIRLPGTEDMDKEYHQKWFHVKVMFPMIPVFAVGGVIIALLVGLIW